MSDFVHTRDDNGRVHYNSGIPNRAFALTAVAIKGFAWERAGQIWYDAIASSRMRPDCDFATFAALTLAAAEDRFGKASAEALAVGSAWKTVGVTGPTETTPATPAVDPKAEVLVRRSGGFAGQTKQRQTALAELPGADRKAWQGLLASDTLPKLAANSKAHPDSYSYRIRCDNDNVEWELPELSLPKSLRRLPDRFLGEN